MLNFYLVLTLCLGLGSLKAQLTQTCQPADCQAFRDAMDSAKLAIQNGNYQRAMKVYDASAALAQRYCNMNCDELINAAIDSLFLLYIDPPLRAFQERERYKEEAKQAWLSKPSWEKDFYDWQNKRFACLSFDYKSILGYGYVDAQAEELLGGFRFDTATQFKAYGYAQVREQGQDLLLDTFGQTYTLSLKLDGQKIQTQGLLLNKEKKKQVRTIDLLA